jgi:N-methylhydantoinase A/oxoprolinase/acetone carboxylase beta subunit
VFPQGEDQAAEASLVNHGTTLVINSLIQRKGAKTALVTSKDFATFSKLPVEIGPIRSIYIISVMNP